MNAESIFEFLKFSLPLAGATVAWFMNERRKRSAEEYERKEKKYAALIEALHGFYTSAKPDKALELREMFLRELDNCWLYCPDDVLRKASVFLASVHTGANTSNEDRECAVGEFMLAIRKDLLSRKSVDSTKLTAQDFKHLRNT